VDEPTPTAPSASGGTMTRVKSGLIGFAILMALLLGAEALGLGFELMLLIGAVALVIGVREFVDFALPDRSLGTLPVAIALAVFLMVALALGRFELLTVAIAAAVLGTTLWTLLTARTTDGLGDQSARLLTAVVYVGGTVGFLPLLRSIDGGLGWIVLALGLGWCGDIGGYFAGRAFGRHKLSPMISPKKTWEGFAGGLLMAVAWTALFGAVFFPRIAIGDCVALGLVGCTAGVLGDLVESGFKRTYGVKDSGSFLPGHGGFLDRVDSVMFTLVVTYLYAVVVFPATR
jgi:phosphatidate cytidylyltransferase